MSNINWIKSLTPAHAWNKLVSEPVVMFVSYFFDDGITDTNEICRVYSKEVLDEMNTPYGPKIHEHLTQLLADHINSYVAANGGIDNLKLYTEKELEQLFQEDAKELLDLIAELENK